MAKIGESAKKRSARVLQFPLQTIFIENANLDFASFLSPSLRRWAQKTCKVEVTLGVNMIYVRAFIAGIALPSVILPFVVCILWGMGQEQLLSSPFIHFIPLLWGIWNVLYFAFFKDILPDEEILRLLLTGAGLGLIVAIIGIFWADIPFLVGLTGNFRYLPLIGAPVLYGILWWLVVNPLNQIVGIRS